MSQASRYLGGITKSSRLVAYLLAATVACGCVPMVTSFYEPIGPGRIYGSGCSSGRNQLGFEVADGFGIMVKGWDSGAEKLGRVSIRFFVGPGHVLRLLTPSVQISEKNSDIAQSFDIDRVIFNEREQVGKTVAWTTREFSPNDPLVGAKDSEDSLFVSKFQTYRQFRVKIDTGGLDGKSLRLHIPAVTLDGKLIQIPDVRFEYGRVFEWVGVMC